MKSLFAILLFHFVALGAQSSELDVNSTVGEFVKSHTVKIESRKISDFLDQARKLETLPKLKFPVPIPQEVGGQLPQEIEESFKRVQKVALTASAGFTLYASDGSQGPLTCDIEKQRIGVAVDLVQNLLSHSRNPKIVLDLMLAHELSHFLVETYIQVYSQDSKSPSGLLSRILQSQPRAFSPTDPSLKLLNNEAEFVGTAAATHAEVDAFAILILQKMGYSKAAIQQAFWDSFQISEDFSVQVKNLSPPTSNGGVRASRKTKFHELLQFDEKNFFEQLGVLYVFEPLIRANSIMPLLK